MITNYTTEPTDEDVVDRSNDVQDSLQPTSLCRSPSYGSWKDSQLTMVLNLHVPVGNSRRSSTAFTGQVSAVLARSFLLLQRSANDALDDDGMIKRIWTDPAVVTRPSAVLRTDVGDCVVTGTSRSSQEKWNRRPGDSKDVS